MSRPKIMEVKMLRLFPQCRRTRSAQIAVLACALMAGGCSRYSTFAPSGSGVVVAPPVESDGTIAATPTLLPGRAPLAVPVRVRPQPKLTVSPERVVAPIGSEVILLASLCGRDGLMMPNQRVEWMIAPNDAGQLLTLGDRDRWSLFQATSDRPRKLTNKYVIGSTAGGYESITRGTPSPADDLCVKPGQAWVAVTSPVEGTSRVTGYAPGIPNWQLGRDTAVIHWVDAQVSFPITAINAVGGSHALTTTVVRSSNQQPLAGWTVRYQIVGGPAARFAPGDAQTIDVTTNAAGQATAEISQPTPARGTNQVRIDVIRPPLASDPDAAPFVVNSGSVMATWSAPEIQVRTTGPSDATIGSIAVYQLAVSNAGDMPASDVALSVTLPDGVSLAASRPEATQQGATLRWNLDEVAAREARTIHLEVRTEKEATIDICGALSAANGQTARSCATTRIGVAPVDPQPQPQPRPQPQPTNQADVRLTLSGPQTAKVGGEIVYEATIRNVGGAAATGLTIADTFDDGLEHVDPFNPDANPMASPLRRKLADLAAGATETVKIRFRVKRAGTMCHTVEVSGPGIATSSQRACVTAQRDAPREHAAMTVAKTGPTDKLRVGGVAEFRIVVENTGNVPLTAIEILDNYDDAFLKPKFASDAGYQADDMSDNDVVWKFERLEPGKKVEVTAQCQCLAAVARTCSKVVVRTAERPPIVEEACVAIETAIGALPNDRPPRTDGASLSMELADRSDPVVVGTEMTYEIVVKNERAEADANVVLTVTFPPGLRPVDGMTGGPSRHTIDGQTVRFSAVRELRPGERLPVYRIRVSVEKAGNHLVKAELKSDSMSRPIAQAEDTTAYEDQ